MRPDAGQGFTLIELAIAIVVIALLAAGILLGRDLVYNAEVRKISVQFDRFNNATLAFKLKYQCIPGDCRSAYTAGVATTNAVTYAGNGNGNDIVDSTTEAKNFWYHLSAANLIPWRASATDPGFLYTCTYAGVNYSPCLEFSRIYTLRDPAGWWVLYGRDPAFYFTGNGLDFLISNDLLKNNHYWWITGRVQNNYGYTGVLMPLDASIIDMKVDDGLPLSGNTFAIGPGANAPYGPFDPEIGAGGPTGVCVNNSVTPNLYNVENTGRTNWRSYCSLLIKAVF